jgi:hypothetical protein
MKEYSVNDEKYFYVTFRLFFSETHLLAMQSDTARLVNMTGYRGTSTRAPWRINL